MKPSLLTQFGGAFATLAIASAAPTPVSGPLAGPGDGVNVHAVQYTPSIAHNIAQAEAALALAPGNPNYVGEFNGIAAHIDVADGNYAGAITVPHDAVPFAGADPLFAVRFSGYLNVVEAGNYTFRSFTDDGFRLTLGGEVISLFNADRGPAASVTGVIPLAAGLYPIDFLGWEQGGAFVNELSWITPGKTDFSVPESQVLFTKVPETPGVPDGGSTAALLTGAGVALAALSRRSRAHASR